MKPIRTALGIVVFSITIVVLVLRGAAASFADDFEDGNDTGWTRYNPLTEVVGAGGDGTWTVADGEYRLQAAGATAPGIYGPARVGSFRTELEYSEFILSFDLVNFAAELDQLFGCLARTRQLSIGAVSGYAFTYSTRAGRNPLGELEILRIADEQGTTIASTEITLQPTNDYRFVFTGLGQQLTGQIFLLPDVSAAIATISAIDPTFTTGFNGVFTYDNSSSGMNTVDFTVDNFSSSAPLPSLNITIPAGGGIVRVTWPKWATNYDLQFSTSLTTPQWTNLAASQDENSFFFEEVQAESGFFRLRSR